MVDQVPPSRARESARAPARPVGVVEPLLTAGEAYPALEQAALAARHSVWLWFRIFDPCTPLVSRAARAVGATWADLIGDRLDAGLRVAVAVSDFDPLARPELHRGAWRAARALAPLAARGALDVMVADHGARAGLGWRLAMWPVALWRLERLRRRSDASAEELLAEAPGLRRYFEAGSAGLRWRAAPPPRLAPCTHHQKVAVFDGARAILGGIDVDPRRWDTPDHARPAHQTWRDLSLAVDGPVAADVARHVAELWNAERTRLGAQVRPLQAPPAAAEVAAVAPSIRLSVTRSEARRGLGLAPRQVRRDLERDHLALIARAEKLVHIETQFLRSGRIARALAARAKAAPALGLILVLPAAPEDVAFDGARGVDARFGERLQARCVARLLRAFGDRAAIVSPAQRARREAADADVEDRSVHFGAGLIYVHTKAMIVDDAAAIVSSANLNGRSLRWDTEAGLALRHPAAAAMIRRRLSESLLLGTGGPGALALQGAPRLWRRIAEADAARPPELRASLILPYDPAPAERFGAPAPGAPEELV